MTLPDLAEVDDLVVRIGRVLSSVDSDRAAAAITDVSRYARGAAEQQWLAAPDGVPEDVVAVVLDAALRRFVNPNKVVSETYDSFSLTRVAGSIPDGPFTPGELIVLHKYRPKAGLWTVGTTRGEHDWETGFVNDDRPGSDPIVYGMP